MMNIDQARAGGEGLIGTGKKPKNKKRSEKDMEMEESSTIVQSEDKPLKISVPDGWSVER